jgi:protease YdgD
MKILSIFLFFIFPIFHSFASDKNLFGEDNRKIVTANEIVNGLRNVVHLGNGCTGSFVGDRLIITAAHCVVDEKTNKVIKPKIYYKRDGKEFEETYTSEEVWVSEEYTKPSDPQDWAIILIAENRNSHFFGFTTAGKVSQKVNLAGYSKDLKKQMGLHENCTLRDANSNLFLHDCDSTRGASGSPIFFCDEENFQDCKIVAVHKGAYRGESHESLHLDNFNNKFANKAVRVIKFNKFLSDLKLKYNVDELNHK